MAVICCEAPRPVLRGLLSRSTQWTLPDCVCKYRVHKTVSFAFAVDPAMRGQEEVAPCGPCRGPLGLKAPSIEFIDISRSKVALHCKGMRVGGQTSSSSKTVQAA